MTDETREPTSRPPPEEWLVQEIGLFLDTQTDGATMGGPEALDFHRVYSSHLKRLADHILRRWRQREQGVIHDLLAALEAAADAIDVPPEYVAPPHEVVYDIRAALARAKGE